MQNEISPNCKTNITDIFKGILEALNVCNIKSMPVHDRKDILIIVLYSAIILIGYWVGLVGKEVAQWSWYILLVNLAVRITSHSFHYEAKPKRK